MCTSGGKGWDRVIIEKPKLRQLYPNYATFILMKTQKRHKYIATDTLRVPTRTAQVKKKTKTMDVQPSNVTQTQINKMVR